ncbi:chalcone isomerase family protein [Shewanella avicenniae]|uniref:Chalcone isomerase family protein n=1 Tax=Shewanella avicenniae TaxID=2814294 RepID=A0ABX7QUM9_9GAMM|nr:chalcone isomerase family protein [Shewanella avicenniae]QSX34558.1 chalcone isomerase family protein [Shewanella avicenniae]
MKWRLMLSLLGILAAPVLAAPVKAEPTQEWVTWPSVGQAKLSWLWFDIYHSTLRSPSGRYEGDGSTVALQIVYQRDISAEELLKATEEQWQQLGFTDEQVAQWLPQLSAIFPSVNQGDQLVYVSSANKGRFYWRQQASSTFEPLAHIDNPQLDSAFLAIWLSPNSAYPKLRQQLIGAT